MYSNITQRLKLVVLLLISTQSLGCRKSPSFPVGYDVTQNGVTVQSPPSSDYQLVFEDNFEGTELDTTKWNYYALGPRREAINSKDAIHLDGHGNLEIRTFRSGSNVFTGMIDSKTKFDFKYGYLECRASVQKKLGSWSAFWMLPCNIIDGASPAVGGSEIDIFEHFKLKGKDVFDNDLFWGGYGSGLQGLGTKVLRLPGLENGFHNLCLEWTPGAYIFSIDGYKTWQDSFAVSQQKEFIILSCEVWAPAAGPIVGKNFEDKFTIDYIKVYSK